MAGGFLLFYFGQVTIGILLGMISGFAFAKKSRKKGAIIGGIIGLVLGGYFTSVASFDSGSSTRVPSVVEE